MKKIITLFFVALLAGSTFGQDKTFRFGLKIDPSISWFSPDNSKKFEQEKAGFGFAFGAMGDISFSDNFGLNIGIGMSFENATMNFYPGASADSVYYMLNRDSEFIDWTYGSANPISGDTSLFYLNSRKYRINYFYLPIVLKMKTKQIGMMTYYGQFGLDMRIKTKLRVDDETTGTGTNIPETEDLNADPGAQLINLGLNIGAGVEYNISGSTSLVGGISYVYGLTNALKKEDATLARFNGGTPESITQQATLNGLRITIGVLF